MGSSAILPGRTGKFRGSAIQSWRNGKLGGGTFLEHFCLMILLIFIIIIIIIVLSDTASVGFDHKHMQIQRDNKSQINTKLNMCPPLICQCARTGWRFP